MRFTILQKEAIRETLMTNPESTQRPVRSGAVLAGFVAAILALAIILGWSSAPAAAQTAGEGSVQGTVADPSGAVIPNANIKITNNATGMAIVRSSTSAGFFSISPVLPGTYTMAVSAAGFKTLVQKDLVVNAMQVRTFDPVLSVGTAAETVTVTSAPPVLNTADASIGMTVENTTYASLPIQMNNAQRDPTAFAMLTPGAQTANNGGRLPIVGGTGSYLGQLYLDGMPAETVSQQGDNRLVSQAVSLDAVDQFQVLTSTPPAEYMGAGAENFTMKSGGLKYHGQVSEFFRNTYFDSWSFTAKAATTKNVLGQTIPAPKPAEHQNELSMTFGGTVPFTHNKLFFFVAYDKFHSTRGANYTLYTIPTPLMAQGNFTELNGSPGTGVTGSGANNPAIIYDPTTNNCVGSTCTRTAFSYNGTNNVIPPGQISPIAKMMASFLPAPTNPNSLTNNYFGGVPSGFDNHVIDYRVDFDLSAKHRISTVGTLGTVNYLNNYGSGGTCPTCYGFLPLPYTGGDLANIYPKNFIVEDAYTITPNVVNQLKAGFTRFFQNIHNATENVQHVFAHHHGNHEPAPGAGGTGVPGRAIRQLPGQFEH